MNRVRSTDGTSLAIQDHGTGTEDDRPVLVAVHGYPDNHTVWDGVAALLAEQFRVVTYDVRGTGDSDKPTRRRDYRISQLVADLACVLDTVSPHARVHLLAHDWGSIQAWPALTDARLGGRIASYTSISGPSLDHAAAWLRGVRTHPRAALRQLAHSYYIAMFQLPVLPELAARRGLLDRAIARTDPLAPRSRPVADKVNGIELYRANMLGRLVRPRPEPITVPVQVIAPASDAYVTPDLALGAPRPWVVQLTTHVIPGGHWVVSAAPESVAPLVADFAAAVPVR